MASRYLRFVIANNGRKHVVNAVSEKQAWFLFRNICKHFKMNPIGAKLIDVGGYYPRDIITLWSVENQDYYDVVA